MQSRDGQVPSRDCQVPSRDCQVQSRDCLPTHPPTAGWAVSGRAEGREGREGGGRLAAGGPVLARTGPAGPGPDRDYTLNP